MVATKAPTSRLRSKYRLLASDFAGQVQWSQQLGIAVSPADVAAFLYAVLAHPAYTDRFHAELSTRQVRVPLTLDAELFNRALALGRELLFLHTWGERFVEGQAWPDPVVKNLKAVPATPLPDRFAYDGARQVLTVGDGEFGPVPAAVWHYEISGLKVVQSWLGYRMRNRKGRKSSPLDDIAPAAWSSTYTSELLRLLNMLTCTLQLQPAQAALLDDILAGPLLAADQLPPVPDEYRRAPRLAMAQTRFDV